MQRDSSAKIAQVTHATAWIVELSCDAQHLARVPGERASRARSSPESAVAQHAGPTTDSRVRPT